MQKTQGKTKTTSSLSLFIMQWRVISGFYFTFIFFPFRTLANERSVKISSREFQALRSKFCKQLKYN